jgi:folate-binding protein YgfZ
MEGHLMERVKISQNTLSILQRSAILTRTGVAVYVLRGPGTVQCLQGIFTNDVVKPGDHALIYGAFLTPKGMIVADAWLLRLPDRAIIVTHPEARGQLDLIFQKSLPPRLTRIDPGSADLGALWALGPRAADMSTALGLTVPERPGTVTLLGPGPGAPIAARPAAGAAFGMLFLGRDAALNPIREALLGAGAHEGGDDEFAAAHILAGWPRLQTEIGERTLPQEVRFEEVGGLSYTKGCYTGQETVARLHFRGHANRELRGLIWDGAPALEGDIVSAADGKEVGVITSVLDLPSGTVGLALIRRDIPDGGMVTAGGRAARTLLLPFQLDLVTR